MAARAWDIFFYFFCIRWLFICEGMAPTNTTGPRSRPETRASDYRLCDALVTMNSTSNNKERKPDLMESMIDGGFEREGGSGSIVSDRKLHHLQPSPPHHVD